MSPIQTAQQPMARKYSASMRKAERYLARAKALMRLDDAQPRSPDMDARTLSSARSLRAMTYASLASAYAERAVIEHDRAARKRASQKLKQAAKNARNAS